MLDFLLGTTKYVDIAKKIIAEVKTGTVDNPNELLQKVAQEYGLSDHEKQRVVEEYNVNYFLEKLQEGTQHENFIVMNPVIDECASAIGVDMNTAMDPAIGADMKKAASFDMQFDESAFSYDGIDRMPDVQYDTFDMSEDFLLKVAQDQEIERASAERSGAIERAVAAIGMAKESVVSDLVKTANESPAVAKMIVAEIQKVAQDEDAAWTILEQSKHKLDEVVSADVSAMFADEIEKVASAKENVNLVKAFKMIREALKRGASEKEVEAIVENLLAGTVAAAYLLKIIHDVFTNDMNRGVQIDVKEFIEQ